MALRGKKRGRPPGSANMLRDLLIAEAFQATPSV
jgi:hypothetical protein